MEYIKRALKTDISIVNEKIVDAQRIIDKSFNIMLDSLEGTDEYRKAKIEYDLKKEEKWFFYGRLGASEWILKLIENEDKLNTYNIGADELPF